jgi:hypothetical protein
VGKGLKLDGEWLIRMYDVLPNPNRIRFISMAQKPSDTTALCALYRDIHPSGVRPELDL